MTEQKLNEISLVVKNALLYFLELDKYDLIDIVVSLHNELFHEVKGKYYDYSFHWANKGYGGFPNDSLFKEKEGEAE